MLFVHETSCRLPVMHEASRTSGWRVQNSLIGSRVGFTGLVCGFVDTTVD